MSDYPDWTSFNGTLRCVAPGCRGRAADPDELEENVIPRFASAPSDLCKWHHDQFPRVLDDLVVMWGTLEASVIRAPSKGGNDRVSSSALADVSSLWNPAVSAVLAELDDWTRFLIRTVVHERPLPHWYFTVDGKGVALLHTFSHGLSEETDPRTGLAGIARWHARWLTGYPTLGPALLEDALRHRRAGLRALDTRPVVRIRLKGDARCQHVIEENRWGQIVCEAPLVGIVREVGSSTPSAILCTANPAHAQLSRDQWMDYATARR